MPRTPHYIPGQSRLKKCAQCGEWLPLSEYHKCGYTSAGNQLHRAKCRNCVSSQSERYKDSQASSCTNCPWLAQCRASVRAGLATYCEGDAAFNYRKYSAPWPVDMDQVMDGIMETMFDMEIER